MRLVAAALAVALSSAARAAECECALTPIDTVDVVFQGTVLSLPDSEHARVRVDRSWRGTWRAEEIVIRGKGPNCLYGSYEAGRTYLFLADRTGEGSVAPTACPIFLTTVPDEEHMAATGPIEERCDALTALGPSRPLGLRLGFTLLWLSAALAAIGWAAVSRRRPAVLAASSALALAGLSVTVTGAWRWLTVPRTPELRARAVPPPPSPGLPVARGRFAARASQRLPFGLELSPDGGLVAIGSFASADTEILSVQDGGSAARLSGMAAVWSLDGQRLFVGSGWVVHVFDTSTWVEGQLLPEVPYVGQFGAGPETVVAASFDGLSWFNDAGSWTVGGRARGARQPPVARDGWSVLTRSELVDAGLWQGAIRVFGPDGSERAHFTRACWRPDSPLEIARGGQQLVWSGTLYSLDGGSRGEASPWLQLGPSGLTAIGRVISRDGREIAVLPEVITSFTFAADGRNVVGLDERDGGVFLFEL